MSALDSILWDIEDYAGRAAEVVKVTAQIGVLVTRAYPFLVGSLLILLSGLGFWMESGAPTLPQQIAAHAKPGGTTYWAMREEGMAGGLFSTARSITKQQADYTAALKFCISHKGFTGCQQVKKAAGYGV
ncbi:hypothetical protein [Acidithiobacillus ferriphilus]|uniref:hypothetical protein n=1 Tax=Acidithiobacillus ferriphilus TaxID=1689834 RepID=UPI001C07218A|nr:hypothetical protein [Acidithiobacillus ferriphilus]MBU2831899.1 hypothetical protein [Acidithiobacillus ferriphilus]